MCSLVWKVESSLIQTIFAPLSLDRRGDAGLLSALGATTRD